VNRGKGAHGLRGCGRPRPRCSLASLECIQVQIIVEEPGKSARALIISEGPSAKDGPQDDTSKFDDISDCGDGAQLRKMHAQCIWSAICLATD
jgi:hypothetical protein